MSARSVWFAVCSSALFVAACADPPPSPDATESAETARQAISTSAVKYGADDFGTGWYDNQPGLSPQTVAGATFGQLFRATVSGQVYAQPLVSAGTLLVVTEGNNVYGLDPETGAQRWTRNVGVPFRASEIGCGDLTPDLGITGTPVIDTATNIAYFLAKSYVTGSSGPVQWQMHAVSVATGAEAPGFPRTIAGTASNEPAATFDAFHHMQRPGLLLMNGVVYAAFGGHCDIGPWQGWIVAVGTDGNIRSLWTTQAGASRTDGAGIWQSGGGLVSDGPGRIFFTTGNGGAISGPRGGNSPPGTLGEAVVRVDVQPNATLQANDFFMPFNAKTALDPADVDFGSGGPVALPAPFFGTPQFPHLMAVAGKEGFVYLLDRDNLGGVANGTGGADNVVSRVGPNGGVWSKPSVWPGDGGYIYLVTNSGPLFAYHYSVDGTGRPTLAVAGRSTDNFGYTSGAPVVTSNGTASGTGLVWLLWSSGSGGGGAQLRAYDVLPDGAGHMVERFRAPIGTAAKFAAPGVGNGRIYVGTRDGAVYGFGAPIAPVLSAPSTDFGAVVVGASASRTVTVTAQRATTVTAVGTTGAAFAAGATTPALPATLAAGATLTVAVTFHPSATGLVGGTLDITTQGAGTSQFALSGTGQAATAQLVANKPIVSFGGTAVGGVLTGTITFSNDGAQPLTITGSTLPAAPFSASGLPASGAVLAPGATVTIAVAFAPTAIGTYADAVTLRSTGGDVTVALSGNALSAGQLVISALALDAGEVGLGASRTLSFTLTNTGGADVTITKSKPPVLGPFAATTTLNEGTKIAAGQTLIETIRYTPDGVGFDRDAWTLNSDDASGLRDVVLTGDGLDATPALTGFTLNGSATVTAGAIQLTPAEPTRAGTAFWPRAIPSEGLTVSFDATIAGGSGADGLALVLGDPTRGATPTSLGLTGGGLGYSGITGVAIALDTFQNGSDPSANFVGIATGANGDNLIWAATQTAVPDLRAAPRHVTVAVRAGTIEVWLDGLPVLSAPVALPPNVLVGFSAGTGGLTNVHTVSNLSLTGFAAHINFQLAGAAFTGYASDTGATFGPRDSGLQFGWSGDNTANARRRGDASSPDPRYDTLLHMQKPSLPDARWDLAVPNGTYRVHLVSGDPQNIDSVYRINAEAALVLQGTPTSSVRWFDGSATVAVSDGKLTLSNAAGSANNKVCFVDVTLVTP